MNILVAPSVPSGTVKAISSKSVAHRLLICAAFADAPSSIVCDEINADIEATVDCLCELGADIKRAEHTYIITPLSDATLNSTPVLRCKESGSTLRFLLPIVAALGINACFIMEGRLADRPLSPLDDLLRANGSSLTYPKKNILSLSGRLTGSSFAIEGNVSSQFISGMLFAAMLIDHPTRLTVTGKLESLPYVDLTVNALRLFGIEPSVERNVYCSRGKRPTAPTEALTVEGDWSNAAFPLCLGVMGKGEVRVSGLDPSSIQGDRAIVNIIKRFGGNISFCDAEKSFVSRSSKLHGTSIDAAQIPDLVPIIATMASIADGQTVIYGASRLKLKESDRLSSTSEMLSALGADIVKTDDGLTINGRGSLIGAAVSSFNDHRIAMSAAVAACASSTPVTVIGADAVSKSYPSFFEDMSSLGIDCKAI